MSRFHFPLESVLNLKRRLHRETLVRWQRYANQVDLLRHQIRSLLGRLDDMSERMDRAVSDRQSPPTGWHTQYQISLQLMGELEQAREQLNEQQQQCHQCRQQLHQLQIEVESLESLRQHAWHEYQRHLDRAGQREIDELMIQRHARHEQT